MGGLPRGASEAPPHHLPYHWQVAQGACLPACLPPPASTGTPTRPTPAHRPFAGSGNFAHDLRNKLQNDFLNKMSTEPLVVDGEVLQPPKPLEWYPDHLGWQMDLSKSQLRKVRPPSLRTDRMSCSE